MKVRFTLNFLFAMALLGGTVGAEQLPFSNAIPNRPAVSPYLGLLNVNNPGVSNYLTIVRPQLEAREQMVRQQAQISQIRQAQRQIERGLPGGVPVRGSQEIRGTGHETAFMNYLHYYPARR